VLLLLAVVRPPVGQGPWRLLDGALLLCLIAVAAQLIPLQASVRERLSPQGFAVDRVVALDAEPAIHPPHPLSVDAESTGWALALGAVYIGLFWCARGTFSRGGLRSTIRGVAFLGMALTALVAVQRATSPTLLYWTWKPISVGASPFGPFVNRNGLATWLAMAAPLVIGYAMTRHQLAHRSDGGAIPGESIDPTQLWLGAAAILMTGGLLASMSRAGILGLATGLTAFVLLSRKRIRGGGSLAWMIAGLVALVVMASAYANLGRLAMRLQETTEQGAWGRPAIWRDTWRMASDFWLTGVGAGAFQRGMLAYQEGSRLFFFNHAHDEYLQLLAEGGVLLVVPAAAALLAAVVLMARRLGADHTAMFWVRAGAISGLVAVAVQSIWDTGLRMPANGTLFAVIAAIALHEPRSGPDRSGSGTARVRGASAAAYPLRPPAQAGQSSVLWMRSHFGAPRSTRQMYNAGSRRFDRTPYRARM
jgi:O-antigen ligase